MGLAVLHFCNQYYILYIIIITTFMNSGGEGGESETDEGQAASAPSTYALTYLVAEEYMTELSDSTSGAYLDLKDRVVANVSC